MIQEHRLTLISLYHAVASPGVEVRAGNRRDINLTIPL